MPSPYRMGGGAPVESLADFLAVAQLAAASENYLDLLSRAGVDLPQLASGHVTDEQLLKSGVEKPFHRKRILRHAARIYPCGGNEGLALAAESSNNANAATASATNVPAPAAPSQENAGARAHVDEPGGASTATAASTTAAGAQSELLQATVERVMAMGFPEDTARAALRDAGGNPVVAVELLLQQSMPAPGAVGAAGHSAAPAGDSSASSRSTAASDAGGSDGGKGDRTQWLALSQQHEEAQRQFLRGDVWGAIECWAGCVATLRAQPQQRGSRKRESICLGCLGLAYHQLGQAPEAIEHSRAALDIARQIGDRTLEGNWLGNLGLTLEESSQGVFVWLPVHFSAGIQPPACDLLHTCRERPVRVVC